MAKYLLIESRDPFTTADVAYYYDLAANLARQGDEVTLFLVQNGVLPTRRGAVPEALQVAADASVEVLADDFSLRERGITTEQLGDAIRPAPLETVIDQLADGRKAMWH